MTTTSTEPEILEKTSESLNAFTRYWRSINWDHILSIFIEKGIAILLFTILFILLNRLGKKAIHQGYQSYQKKQNEPLARAKTIRTLLDNIFNYTLFFFYIYTILTILGVPIGSLLAGAGIAGLAIGLGAQGFMNDIITGFFILLEQQLDIGDYVKLQNINIEGNVIALGLRTTQLKSKDGTLHFIPNRNITTISNQSRFEMRAFIDIPILPSADLEKVNQIIQQTNDKVKNNHPEITQGPAIVGLTDLGNGHFIYRTSLYTINGQQSNIQTLLLKKQMEALSKAQITIPETPLLLSKK